MSCNNVYQIRAIISSWLHSIIMSQCHWLLMLSLLLKILKLLCDLIYSFTLWCYGLLYYFFPDYIGFEMQVSDGDDIDRSISRLFLVLPFFFCGIDSVGFFISPYLVHSIFFCSTKALVSTQRGASNNKFLNYLNKHIIPIFDKVILWPCVLWWYKHVDLDFLILHVIPIFYFLY